MKEWRICARCQIMTQKTAAEILKMTPSTLFDLLHQIITRVRHRHKVCVLITLGVDEISFFKGRKFVTLVYDLDRARVLWASLHMSRAYTEATKHHCPKATLVIDRFHVVNALNQAVDEVRKDEWRALDTEGRKAIKGLRWLLSMHSSSGERARGGQYDSHDVTFWSR